MSTAATLDTVTAALDTVTVVEADPAATLGIRLRQAMGRRGVDHVAARSRVTERTIWRILAGAHKGGPDLGTIEALAAATDVRPAWLAWGDGAMRG